MFSPLAFPSGTLIYDLSTSLPPPSHLSLSPFEQFREPLLVIGIADATEYPVLDQSRAEGEPPATTDKENIPENGDQILSAIDDLRDSHPRASVCSLIMFDSSIQGQHPQLPLGTFHVPPADQLKATTIKTLMCDLTSILLAELTTLAKSIEALPIIPSPASQAGLTDSVPNWAGADSLGSQFSRRNSQVPTGSRPESPLPGAQKDIHRMSMPVLPSGSGASSSAGESRATSPTAGGARTPPTTFDEISGINAANALHRTSSNSAKPNGTREPSVDRVSIHGFGSGGVGERARNKARGRVSVIIGTLFMSAGQWNEAVLELSEGAMRARALSDHLWHAKALEHIMVCLLLYAWSGFDFQVSMPIHYLGSQM